MLIYNFQKEFLGIDDKDLHSLGYKDLAQLQTEVKDVADLFVKTPGYIHNFRHVQWIDFITCAQSNEESKVIINANAKSYKAVITITTAYLVDNPTQKAYLVHLNNLRALTPEEYENISGDLTQRTTREETPQPVQIIPPVKEQNTVIPDEYDIQQILDIKEPTPTPQEPTPKEQKEPTVKEEAPLHVTPKKLDITPEPENKTQNNYVFDPNIASKELGLPLDLIEEFIQDFIDQANDFKKGLYTALDEGDINNVKILSHKLKGVAANLRIEDAYEVLSIVNAASDADVIKTNLDDFYNIIAKLSGEETVALTVKDEDIPEKIEILELIDDDFIAPQEAEEELTLEFKEEAEPLSESSEKYSKEKIANEIGIDLESFNELFDEFINEAHTIVTKINEAVQNNDYKTSKRQALKLKGMSDNMRMHTFTNELETLIYSTDKDAIVQAVKQIEHVLTTIPKKED
ncbi:Hpt domain-containing protein [Sulfurimonas sp.]